MKRAQSAQLLAYDWIKQRIASEPRHGGAFLTEADVTDATGVSRTPAREALLRLGAEGLVQIVPKKGAFIPPISDSDIDDVMTARRLVEEWAVEIVVPRATEIVATLRQLIEDQRSRIDEPVKFIEADRLFHHTIVEAAGNPVLARFYSSLQDKQLRMGVQAVSSSAERAQLVLAEHTAIVDALSALDTEVATDATRTHLFNTWELLRRNSAADPFRPAWADHRR